MANPMRLASTGTACDDASATTIACARSTNRYLPDSREYVQKALGHLPEDVRRKVVCENAGRLYGFPIA